MRTIFRFAAVIGLTASLILCSDTTKTANKPEASFTNSDSK